MEGTEKGRVFYYPRYDIAPFSNKWVKKVGNLLDYAESISINRIILFTFTTIVVRYVASGCGARNSFMITLFHNEGTE
jgi:hypothetical protein